MFFDNVNHFGVNHISVTNRQTTDGQNSL